MSVVVCMRYVVQTALLFPCVQVCFFFKPLYILMEEVPDVASKGNVMEFICSGYEAKGVISASC